MASWRPIQAMANPEEIELDADEDDGEEGTGGTRGSTFRDPEAIGQAVEAEFLAASAAAGQVRSSTCPLIQNYVKALGRRQALQLR